MRRFLTIPLLTVAFAAPTYAQKAEIPILPFDHIATVTEAEPAIIEIVLVQADGKEIKLRMPAMAAQDLAARIEDVANGK
jgi:hypothetical protein